LPTRKSFPCSFQQHLYNNRRHHHPLLVEVNLSGFI
jgi:hypothetical protein